MIALVYRTVQFVMVGWGRCGFVASEPKFEEQTLPDDDEVEDCQYDDHGGAVEDIAHRYVDVVHSSRAPPLRH